MAADWRIESAATVLTQAETNPRLQADSAQDVVGGGIDVQLGVRRDTETLTLAVDSRLQSRRYTEDISLDRDEYQAQVTANFRGELHQLAMQAAFGRDTTLSSELGTTGLSRVNLSREQSNFSLSPSWRLTERLSGGGALQLQQIHYLGNESFDLVDYRYTQASTRLGYQFSQRGAAAIVASSDRLKNDGNQLTTNDYFVVLQTQYGWSPQWSASASLGPSWVETGGVRDTGLRYNATLTHQSQYTTMSASAGRSVAPAGRGLLTRREDLSLRFTHRLREYIDVSLSASHQRSRDIIPIFSFTYNDVRYERIELGLAWRFAEDWRLGVSAGGSQQHIIQINDKGTNFDARLHLAWNRSADPG